MHFPRRWEDRTPEHEAAQGGWLRYEDPQVDRYNGCGCMRTESVLHVALRAKTDDSLVLRAHTTDWSMLNVEAQHRLPVEVRGGRRVLNLSHLLPEATRTLFVEADDHIPPGCALLLTAGGQEVSRVAF